MSNVYSFRQTANLVLSYVDWFSKGIGAVPENQQKKVKELVKKIAQAIRREQKLPADYPFLEIDIWTEMGEESEKLYLELCKLKDDIMPTGEMR